MKLIVNIKYECSLIAAFILICTNLNSQVNLVPNYSFEQVSFCPSKYYNPPPHPWYLVSIFGTGGTYANSCDTSNWAGVPLNYVKGKISYQYARTGNAYIGIEYFGSNRSYLQVKLQNSLKVGNCYYAEHFVNVPNPMGYACNDIGMLFTDTAFYADTTTGTTLPYLANAQVLNYGNPIITDTLNWVKVSGVFTAKGGEQYLTLGNFYQNNKTQTLLINLNGYPGAGYYIDDVSVIPLDSMQLKADSGRDTTIIKGDSVFIGSYTNGLTNITWYDAGGNVIDTGAPGLWVKPTANTFYVIEQNVCGQYSRDTVNITVVALPVIIDNYKLIIDNGIQKYSITNVWETSTEINTSHFNIQRSTDGISFETIGNVSAKGASIYSFNDQSPLWGGLLYYRLEIVDKNGSKTYSDVKELSIINYQLSIAPNPSKDYISIIGSNIKQIIISDISGRVLLKSIERKIDVSGLVSGTYIVQIETLNGIHVTQKLVKLP